MDAAMEDAGAPPGSDWDRGSGGAEAVLGLAGAGASLSVCYHEAFGPHADLILLEAGDDLLPDLLQGRVTVRGRPEEEAVLCTPSATYAMKFVGTSNSMFLIPPGEAVAASLRPDHTNEDATVASDASASIIKVAPGSIELVRTAPRLDKLRSLLRERPYVLDEDLGDDSEDKKGLYTWEDLCVLVQSSDSELLEGLNSLSAVEIDGFWRTVDVNSVNTVLDMILHNSVLHDWLLNALPENGVLSVMESDGFTHKIVAHCLSRFGTKVEQEAGSCWRLDERLVCLQFARKALSAGKMKLNNFMDKWERSIPSGMRADLQMLEGEVLYERLGAETWVHAFSVADLPLTPAERFAALFGERPRWEWKDLQPFIRDLRVPGASSEGLLIKYARRTQPSADADPIFTAR
ncbi:sister chromatid cohesion protein DCC1 [Hordeum vulgare]|uniref:Sister chromatid cohesion protein DCC1 n=1 Tax=Hordeum vulgare subsp. vulgare TaxID=112509 RepID=A0A8I6Y848_HORVV|nr:sister chromatid cohesion protein DCC1 [Hordeum vulgare subsp. vulgare]KAE8800608.1 sister chromatid cohesion protein DCC1 [Hordeum vulgare]